MHYPTSPYLPVKQIRDITVYGRLEIDAILNLSSSVFFLIVSSFAANRQSLDIGLETDLFLLGPFLYVF